MNYAENLPSGLLQGLTPFADVIWTSLFKIQRGAAIAFQRGTTLWKIQARVAAAEIDRHKLFQYLAAYGVADPAATFLSEYPLQF